MIYIIIILSSIMAFYFFIVAFISNKKQSSEKTYYDEPQLEKVKDITFGLSKFFEKDENEVNNKEDTTSSIPHIIESNPISVNSEEMPTMIQSTPINNEQANLENINHFEDSLIKDERKIITDEEII